MRLRTRTGEPERGKREDTTPTRDSGYRDGKPLPFSTGWIGLFLLCVLITMLFAAFTSAYLERVVGAGHMLPLAPALWFSTATLLLSSGVVEHARAAARRGEWVRAGRALGLTALLGLLFATGQFTAWRQLLVQEVFLQSSPHSSFFYLLTLMHVLHLAGGIGWLLFARARIRRLGPWLRLVSSGRSAAAAGEVATPAAATSREAAGAEGVALCAFFWHFLGGLWVYLFVLLYVV